MQRAGVLVSGVAVVLVLGGCGLFSRPSLVEQQRRLAARRTAFEPAPAAEVTWREKVRLGDRLRARGDREGALVAYLEAVRLGPDEPTPRVHIALLHLEREPARSESILEDVVRAHPECAPAHTGLGLARLAQGRPVDAEAALERALALAPEDPAALGALAVVRALAGSTGDAVALLERARAQRPDDAHLANNLGVVQLRAGDLEAAEGAFREAARLDPDDPAPRNNLGLVLGLLGRYADAYDAFLSAGDTQAAENNLGRTLLLNGDVAEATRHFERALAAPGAERRTVLRNLDAALDAAERARAGPDP